MSQSEFKPSKLTINVKLISIISFIMVSVLTFMILLATYYFKDDSKTSIQDNNLQLVNILGQKVENELLNASYESLVIANIFRNSPGLADQFSENFFRNNENFIYLAIAERQGQSIKIVKSVANGEYYKTHQVKEDIFNSINKSYEAEFLRSFNGENVVTNTSAGFFSPLLALSIPYQMGSSIIILYIDAVEFLKAFQSSGINTTFLVSNRGDVLAHPDSKMVIAVKNMIDVPIVKKLLQSKVGNETTSYKDEDGLSYLGAYKKLNLAGLGIISTVQEDKAFESIYKMQKRNFYITVIVLAVSVLIVFFFARTMTIPIIRLVAATKKVEAGDFKVDLVPASRDEIGILTNSFKSMADGLEERERVKAAFGKFVNKEIAEQAAKGEIKLGGERKKCAIFFSDIRSFTSISEKLEPEEVVEFLNEYMTAMVGCINATGGIVDKFIGDAIMATWGTVQLEGNPAEHAINSALMMRKALMEFNQGRGGDKKPVIRIGCGMNYGPVIAGQIGSNERLEYTVIGDAVNLASRVEALNKPMGTDVLITSDMLEEVADIYKVQKMQSIKVKGKSEPQVIYSVLGRLDDPESPNSLEELRSLVGIEYNPEKASKSDGEEVKYEILED